MKIGLLLVGIFSSFYILMIWALYQLSDTRSIMVALLSFFIGCNITAFIKIVCLQNQRNMYHFVCNQCSNEFGKIQDNLNDNTKKI